MNEISAQDITVGMRVRKADSVAAGVWIVRYIGDRYVFMESADAPQAPDEVMHSTYVIARQSFARSRWELMP